MISEKAFTPVKEINTQNSFAILKDNMEGQDNNSTKKIEQEKKANNIEENSKPTIKEQHHTSTKDLIIRSFANYHGKGAGNNNNVQNKFKNTNNEEGSASGLTTVLGSTKDSTVVELSSEESVPAQVEKHNEDN